MVICYLIGCKSRSERKLQDITYHTFPKDSAIRQIWIRATRRLNWQPTKYTRICSRHFVQNCFRKTAGNMTYLKESSIPTLHIAEQHAILPLPPQLLPHELKNVSVNKPLLYYPQPFSYPGYPVVLYL